MPLALEIDPGLYPTEPALVAGLQRGDRQACACLLRRYMPRLYRLALSLTGDGDDAEDVLQDSLIQACRQIGRFESRSGLQTWLHRIVVNTALQRARRHTPPLLSLEALPGASGNHVPGELPPEVPEDLALSHELLGQIEHAILALPPTLRAAVVLRDVEGLSTLEAAQALGIGESALKVRLHRGRLALRVTLAPYVAGSLPG